MANPDLSSQVPDGLDMEQLLTQNFSALQAYLRLKVGPGIRGRESCSDLAQSVCRELLKDRDQFVFANDTAFRSCLFQAAERKIVERHRYYTRKKRDVNRTHSLENADELSGAYASIASPSAEACVREEIWRLEEAFDKLPEEYREVILLSRVAGLSHREIGTQMGRGETASRKLLSRAIARLGSIMLGQESVQADRKAV